MNESKLNWLFLNTLHKGFAFSKEKYFLIFGMHVVHNLLYDIRYQYAY